jgi:general secretion pathway protein J
MTTRRSAPRAAVNGFTLVELLISFALMAMLSVLLFNSFRVASQTWDAVERRTRGSQDVLLAGLFLQRHLEQAQPLVTKDDEGEARIRFHGDARSMQFVSPLPAPLGRGGLHLFTVELEDEGGTKRLMLSHQLYQDRGWDRLSAPAAPKTVLADQLSDARFDYFGTADGAAWRERWTEHEHLPLLIRLQFIADRGNAPARREWVVAPKMNAVQATLR